MKQKKVAVAMYGYMRTYKVTSRSLIKNVLAPNQADLFVYCFDNEGSSSVPLHTSDINDYKYKNASKQDMLGEPITPERLCKTYGKYLRDYKIINLNAQKFINDTYCIPQIDGLPKVERIYSCYYNITNAIKLVKNFSEKNNINYDALILIRPDLQFYTMVDVNLLDLEKVTIPYIGGNIEMQAKTPIYYCAGYKNVERCEYIPYHTIPFSDQFIISSYKNMVLLDNLYDCLPEYADRCFPTYHSESTIYYHLAFLNNLKVNIEKFDYEILRTNYIDKENSFQIVCNNCKDEIMTLEKKYKDKIKSNILQIKNSLIFNVFAISINWIKYMFYKYKR